MTKVEEVARAIARAELGYDAIPAAYRYEQARAAIKAMREPSEGMTDHVSYITGLWSRSNIEEYVDAALSEGEG